MPRDAAAVAHDLRTARERVEQLGSIVIGDRRLSDVLEEAATRLEGQGVVPDVVRVQARKYGFIPPDAST
jgi:hypothetical protein